MAKSLFRPRSISGGEIEAKREAIALVYSKEFAYNMPWYQVLAVYRSMNDRGKFSDLTPPKTEYPLIFKNPPKKAKRRIKKEDGVQISMFDNF